MAVLPCTYIQSCHVKNMWVVIKNLIYVYKIYLQLQWVVTNKNYGTRVIMTMVVSIRTKRHIIVSIYR